MSRRRALPRSRSRAAARVEAIDLDGTGHIDRDELRAWLARGSLGAPDEDELDRIFNALEDAPGEPLTFENFARLGEVRPRDDVAHKEWLP